MPGQKPSGQTLPQNKSIDQQKRIEGLLVRVYVFTLSRKLVTSAALSLSGQAAYPQLSKARCTSATMSKNIVERYKSNDSFDDVEYCFESVAVFGNNVQRNFVLSTKSK